LVAAFIALPRSIIRHSANPPAGYLFAPINLALQAKASALGRRRAALAGYLERESNIGIVRISRTADAGCPPSDSQLAGDATADYPRDGRPPPQTLALRRRTMDRRTFLAGLTAPAVFAFSAKAQSVARREILRVAPETLTNIFDPHFTTSFTTRDFSYRVFDTLFAVNDRWEPRPQMIERWDRSADSMTWTFTLREGLAFHDGSAVTSGDCVASLRRWGARDALGVLLIGATKSLEPVDARRFQLQLREPFGFVLDAGRHGANDYAAAVG
jgi:Bacterial extracellular solute-binding proteins, family 5 Middle